jgi:hypothetical protein
VFLKLCVCYSERENYQGEREFKEEEKNKKRDEEESTTCCEANFHPDYMSCINMLKYFNKLCRNEKQQYEFSKKNRKTNANHAIQSRKNGRVNLPMTMHDCQR